MIEGSRISGSHFTFVISNAKWCSVCCILPLTAYKHNAGVLQFLSCVIWWVGRFNKKFSIFRLKTPWIYTQPSNYTNFHKLKLIPSRVNFMREFHPTPRIFSQNALHKDGISQNRNYLDKFKMLTRKTLGKSNFLTHTVFTKACARSMRRKGSKWVLEGWWCGEHP